MVKRGSCDCAKNDTRVWLNVVSFPDSFRESPGKRYV
jgi:hypothetical protein